MFRIKYRFSKSLLASDLRQDNIFQNSERNKALEIEVVQSLVEATTKSIMQYEKETLVKKMTQDKLYYN